MSDMLSPTSEKGNPMEGHGPVRPSYHRHGTSTASLDGRGWRTRLLTFLVHLKAPEEDKEKGEKYWLPKEQRAPEWLELFYDLVIVAVLSVFSSTHEVSTGQSVLVYFSYFIIIWWVWASQTLYDVHFQANDWVHRLFKAAQLGAFAFLGACSAGFDPYNVVWSDDVSQEAALTDAKATSFRGVAIAYAVGRALLVLQYLFVVVRLMIPVYGNDMTKHKGHVSLALFPACVHAVSGALWVISALLTNSAPTKLALAYAGIFIEFVSVLFHPLLRGYMKPPATMISERFGALTLIILGEGIIGLIRSFSFVISGFGFTYAAYIQCFCALIIVFGAWHFLFHGFNSEEFHLRRKGGAIWLILHLPLHFAILLLFAGIRSATVYGNMADAVLQVDNNLNAILVAVKANDLASVQVQNDWMTMQLGKLDLDTPWQAELQLWNESYNNPKYLLDGTIEVDSYSAEIVLAIADSFQVELSDDMLNMTQSVITLNNTYLSDATQRGALEQKDYTLFTAFQTAFSIEIAEGVLFFFPAAGALLLLASLQVLLRAMPLGLWMWANWVLQICAGIVLCLLGFLGVGNQFTNPAEEAQLLAYKLLDINWLMPIVAIIYAFLILVEYWLLTLAKCTDPEAHHEHEVHHSQSMPELHHSSSSFPETPRAMEEGSSRQRTPETIAGLPNLPSGSRSNTP